MTAVFIQLQRQAAATYPLQLDAEFVREKTAEGEPQRGAFSIIVYSDAFYLPVALTVKFRH